MRYRIFALFSAMAALCLPFTIHAQTGFVTVYGSKLTDANGVAANAQVCAQAVDVTGKAISVKVGGGGTTTTQQVCVNAAGGTWSMKLPDTRLSSPVNAGFAFTATDNVSGADLIGPGYGFVQPTSDPASKWCTSTLCDFDNLPPMSKPPVGATFLQGASGTNGLNGKDGAVGCPVGATACNGVIGTTPTGNQYVKQPANTSTYTTSLNGWQYVGDATSGVDILTQVQTAYNACNVLQTGMPNKCNIRVNPAPSQSDPTISSCWVSTGTLNLPRHNDNSFTIDFTGARICHSGPNGMIDMSGGQVSNMGGSLIDGLEAYFTGEEPFIVKTAVVANIKFRDFNVYSSNVTSSNHTVCFDLHGGNQIEISNSILGQCYDAIKASTGDDGFGILATTISGNSLGGLHQVFNFQNAVSNIVIENNTIQGGYISDFPVGEFHGTQGLKYIHNYHEYGGASSTNHTIWISPSCTATLVDGNTWADGSSPAAIILNEGDNSSFTNNWITTGSSAFVDFGPNIDSTFNLTIFNHNVAVGAATFPYNPATIPPTSSSRPYALRIFEENDTNQGPVDNGTNPYLFSVAGTQSQYLGLRMNSIVAPGTGMNMWGQYKMPNAPTRTPANGDQYLCIGGDNIMYRSPTKCQ